MKQIDGEGAKAREMNGYWEKQRFRKSDVT